MKAIPPSEQDRPKRIRVLSYGGTWSMRATENGTLGANQLGEEYRFEDDFPKVSRFCETSLKELDAVDSSDMSLRDYARIAEVIRGQKDRFDGFVVIQGTDSLEWSAAALSFALADLQVPVVLTGAQLPCHEPGSDAQNNVVNACRVAAMEVERRGHREPAFPEVVVVFGSRIIRGTRCRKVSERDLEAFDTINHPLLGKIQLEISLNEAAIQRDPPRTAHIEGSVEFDENVGLVSLHPSMDPEILLQIGKQSSGVILSTYGGGNIPCTANRKDNPYALEGAIRELVEEEIPVGITTRCVVGAAEMGSYENGAAAQEAGAMILNDLTTEAAYAKLSWVLANQETWPKNAKRALRGGPGYIGAVRKAMLEPLVGEISRGEELHII